MTDFVNLFAGAGGWEVGARGLGLRGIGLDSWLPAVTTQKAAGFEAHQVDVRLASALEDDWADVPGLIASPPCQDYRLTGSRAGLKFIDQLAVRIRKGITFTADTLPNGAGLTLVPLSWIQARLMVDRPYRWIAMEQVPGVLPLWEAYAECLRSYGYWVWTGELDAVDYDVPQTRQRAALMAVWEGSTARPMRRGPACGFADALWLKDRWSLVSNNNAGGSILRGVRHSPAPSFTLTSRCTRMRLTKGHIDPPSSTLHLGHALSIEQAGVLQSFPWNYPWQGSKDERATQIGNAIPPALAGAILEGVVR